MQEFTEHVRRVGRGFPTRNILIMWGDDMRFASSRAALRQMAFGALALPPYVSCAQSTCSHTHTHALACLPPTHTHTHTHTHSLTHSVPLSHTHGYGR